MEICYIIEISTYSHLNINIYINICQMFGQYKCYQILHWQTCSKGMFKIFRFLKITKEEHELLKECFEEPMSVSVNFHSVT